MVRRLPISRRKFNTGIPVGIGWNTGGIDVIFIVWPLAMIRTIHKLPGSA